MNHTISNNYIMLKMFSISTYMLNCCVDLETYKPIYFEIQCIQEDITVNLT